jgi:hypothetical protein
MNGIDYMLVNDVQSIDPFAKPMPYVPCMQFLESFAFFVMAPSSQLFVIVYVPPL